MLRRTLCFFPEVDGLSLALLESILLPEEEEIEVGVELLHYYITFSPLSIAEASLLIIIGLHPTRGSGD